MRFAKRTTPALAAWVTPEFTTGVHACFDALGQLQGAHEVVLTCAFP
jgi:hypothetical protein